MTWDFFNTAAGAASLMGLIVAVILGLVSWRSTRATDRLVSQGHVDTRAILDRMDERADERHREVVEILRELRGED